MSSFPPQDPRFQGTGSHEPVEQPGVVIVSGPGAGSDGVDGADEAGVPSEGVVEEPAKLMRIGSMVKQLLDEVRAAPLDERSRIRLAEIYQISVRELASSLSPDLRDELASLAPPLPADEVPSESELRVAHAQLVGWLEGLFHGIQATLFAQQMAAQAQLAQMRQRQLGPGGPGGPGGPAGPGLEARPGTYL